MNPNDFGDPNFSGLTMWLTFVVWSETATLWIAMKFGSDICIPSRVNCNNLICQILNDQRPAKPSASAVLCVVPICRDAKAYDGEHGKVTLLTWP